MFFFFYLSKSKPKKLIFFFLETIGIVPIGRALVQRTVHDATGRHELWAIPRRRRHTRHASGRRRLDHASNFSLFRSNFWRNEKLKACSLFSTDVCQTEQTALDGVHCDRALWPFHRLHKGHLPYPLPCDLLCVLFHRCQSHRLLFSFFHHFFLTQPSKCWQKKRMINTGIKWGIRSIHAAFVRCRVLRSRIKSRRTNRPRGLFFYFTVSALLPTLTNKV